MYGQGQSEYDVLTHTDPGTPGGDLMRRYWQPAALSEELPAGGAPLPVRIFGEDLVLFRDERGRPGLLGVHCSHRGADLSYGRLEDGGIRCIYHGWLYDVDGRCLEQPGEPEPTTGDRVGADADGSASPLAAAPRRFHERIKHPAYPCVERSGVVWTYMGPGEPPLMPNYEFLTLPEEQVFAIKLFHDCNWLQGNEGNIDLIHLSFLHHNSYRDLAGGNGTEPTHVTGGGAAPHQETVEAELTDYGLNVCKIRDMGTERHLYFCTYMYPCAFAFSGETTNQGYSLNWHVPIDDTHHWKYTFVSSRTHALDKERVRHGRLEMGADYRALRSRANRYQQDRTTMGETYTGIGLVFQAQDMCAVEGAGSIQDRSQEHLTANDAPVVISRKLLLKGIKDVAEGRDPPNVLRDPARNRFPRVFAYTNTVAAETEWKAYVRQVEAGIEASMASGVGGR
jgi:phthalate 4,5-dioxygenase